jgi:hypothetical protein
MGQNRFSGGAQAFGEENSAAVLRPMQLQHVMAGLVPAIHAQRPSSPLSGVCRGAAWMAGTSPAMTAKGGAQPDRIFFSFSPARPTGSGS